VVGAVVVGAVCAGALDMVGSSRGVGTGGWVIFNSGAGWSGFASAGRRAVAPRGAMARSVGEKGSSSRPNRTTTQSSDTAGSVSPTT
jgi:hypothetical protein